MLYVVHIAIDDDRNDDWFRYMRDEHLGDVLATGCFTDVTMVRDPNADTEERTAYRVIYRAHSQAAIDEYQAEHASGLQDDHTGRYDGCFEARREILPIVIRLNRSA